MSVRPLESLQRGMIAAILSGAEEGLSAQVRGGGKLSAAQAIEVYRNGYPARLTGALGETFEACWRVLGDEDFFAACRDYIKLTPSLSYNLSDYGAGFPKFIASWTQAHEAPFLGELARYEWCLKEIFHERPHRVLSASRLALGASPQSRFYFGRAVRLLSLNFRVHGIWKRDRADDTPLTPLDWAGSEFLLLYKRKTNGIIVQTLAAEEYAVLDFLAGGLPLGDALSRVVDLDAVRTKALFQFIAEAGLIARTSKVRS